MKRVLTAALFFAELLIAWQLVFLAKIWSPVLLPSPIGVGSYLWGVLRDGTLEASVLVTMKRLVLGYLIGLAAGLPLGMITARFRPV
jgi:NitT/TauT family transport system permease protein